MSNEDCETEDRKQSSNNPNLLTIESDYANWTRSKSNASFFLAENQSTNNGKNISEHSTVYWDLPEAVEASVSEVKTTFGSKELQEEDSTLINSELVKDSKRLLINTGSSHVKIHRVHFQEHHNVTSEKFDDGLDRRQSTPTRPFHTIQQCESIMKKLNIDTKLNSLSSTSSSSYESTAKLTNSLTDVEKSATFKNALQDEQTNKFDQTKLTIFSHIQNEIKSELERLKIYTVTNNNINYKNELNDSILNDECKTLQNCKRLINIAIKYSAEVDEMQNEICNLVKQENLLETIAKRLTVNHKLLNCATNSHLITKSDNNNNNNNPNSMEIKQTVSISEGVAITNDIDDDVVDNDEMIRKEIYSQLLHSPISATSKHTTTTTTKDRMIVILSAKLLTEILSQNYLLNALIDNSNSTVRRVNKSSRRINNDQNKWSTYDDDDDDDATDNYQLYNTNHNRDQNYIAVDLLKQVIRQSWEYRTDVGIYREYLGIMEPLLKHSEALCQMVIKEGGLRCLVYACRLDDLITLRHTALGLINLALFGAINNFDQVIREHVIDWMFRLAFHEDDVVKYFACLASAVLSNNMDLSAIVKNSGTLDLILPFVYQHSPIEFARQKLKTAFNYSSIGANTGLDTDNGNDTGSDENGSKNPIDDDDDDDDDDNDDNDNISDYCPSSYYYYYSGASDEWLKRLTSCLYSKYLETRVLVTFHFVVETVLKTDCERQHILYELDMVNKFRNIIYNSISLESELASIGLRVLNEHVPFLLRNNVPLWTNQDVQCWLERKGFTVIAKQCQDLGLDGDLLLRLDDDSLANGLKINNPIIRSKLTRELCYLKSIANYSTVDVSGLANWLKLIGQSFDTLFKATAAATTEITKNNSSHNTQQRQQQQQKQQSEQLFYTTNRLEEFRSKQLQLLQQQQQNNNYYLIEPFNLKQYTYNMILAGVHLKLIPNITEQMLLDDCHITNGIHRKMILDAIQNSKPQSRIDVFISYRRSTGSSLASLLKVHLQLKGYRVFLDVDRLTAGEFQESLICSITNSTNFILVLSQNALDRCMGDEHQQDWIHREIACAFKSKCNIIPITCNFIWPPMEALPVDIRSITKYNAVEWNHQYQEACIDKIEKFLIKPDCTTN